MGLGCEAREKPSDFFLAHLRGMTLVVEKDEPFNPVDIGFLGSRTIYSGVCESPGGPDRVTWASPVLV